MNRNLLILIIEVSIFSLMLFSFSTVAKELCPNFVCPPLSAGVNNLTIHAEPSTSGTTIIKCLTTCQCPNGYGAFKVISSGSLSLGDFLSGPDYFEVCGKKHTGSWLFYEDYCNNTNPITLQIYGGNYGYTSSFSNGNFVNVTQIVCSPLSLSCPVCPQPSEWSNCVNNVQTRINYGCDASTSYQCLAYIETRNCSTITPSCPMCPSDTDWTVCVNNEQSRIRYICGNETGYVCLPIVEKRSCEVFNETYNPCLYADFQIYSCSYKNSTPTKGNITLILKNAMNVDLRNLTATIFYLDGRRENYNLKPDNFLPAKIYKAFTIENVDLTYNKILITTHCANVEEESTCNGIPLSGCVSGYTENYRCFGNWLQREYRESNCSLSWRDYEYCELGCKNNKCEEIGKVCGERISITSLVNPERLDILTGGFISILVEATNNTGNLIVEFNGEKVYNKNTNLGEVFIDLNTSKIKTVNSINIKTEPGTFYKISSAKFGIYYYGVSEKSFNFELGDKEVKNFKYALFVARVKDSNPTKDLIVKVNNKEIFKANRKATDRISKVLNPGEISLNRGMNLISFSTEPPDGFYNLADVTLTVVYVNSEELTNSFYFGNFSVSYLVGSEVLASTRDDVICGGNLETSPCIYKLYLIPNFDYRNNTNYTWSIIANDYSLETCPSQINYTIWKQYAGNCGNVVIPSYLIINRNTSKTFNLSMSLGDQEGACEITLRIISPTNSTVETGKYILNEKVRGKGILERIFEFFAHIFSFLTRSVSSRFLLLPFLRK